MQTKVHAVRKAVFIDRDGTLIVEKDYLSDPALVELLPHAGEAVRVLREAGYAVVLTTNQSGVGRGYYTLEAMHAVHVRVQDLLAQCDTCLDGIYYCPHSPEQPCACRKPLPGMVSRAVAEMDLDASCVITIGDKACDVELGQGLGGKGLLVLSGYGRRERAKCAPDFVAETLMDAALWIVDQTGCQAGY